MTDSEPSRRSLLIELVLFECSILSLQSPIHIAVRGVPTGSVSVGQFETKTNYYYLAIVVHSHKSCNTYYMGSTAKEIHIGKGM